ncbi:Nucleotide-sugar transporter [Corchorus capsularis]|uniref:Nucleotide-sugar transporter n=1 Tax=Corchorus capsularis TaxID=210143 RepID=A0A1R3GDC3_COCAP|nr:Nucleotide-sugar transporter [Corchorus capsularis]
MAATKPKASTQSQSSGNMSPRVWLYSILLTLQYGAQPLISKRFTRREVIVTSSVLICEGAKVKKHSSYLMTVEMSIVGSLCLLASISKSPDGEAIRRHGFFYGWTPLTLIPVVANALGGILVGLVTSLAGGVRKGFVIVSALLVTAMLQFLFEGKPPSIYCLMALPLVISSISIYQKYPYRYSTKKKEA